MVLVFVGCGVGWPWVVEAEVDGIGNRDVARMMEVALRVREGD
jgi:hypothetical protein